MKGQKELMPENPLVQHGVGPEAKKKNSTIYKVKNKILLMDEGNRIEE